MVAGFVRIMSLAMTAHLGWQRRTLGLRQERHQEEAQDVDERECHRYIADATKLGDERTREHWAQEGNEARAVEGESHSGGAHARREQFRQPDRHPRILPEREE